MSKASNQFEDTEEDSFSLRTSTSFRGLGKSNVILADDVKSAHSPKAGNFIDLSDETLNYYDSDEEVRVLRFKPSNIPFGTRKRRKTSNDGSCSNSKPPSFACDICVEAKPAHESFGIKNCSHVYCTDCVVK